MIKPWGAYVAVVDPPTDRNDGTASGIILPPGTGLDLLDKGIVVGVGPFVEDSEYTPEDFGVGAAVWYGHGRACEVGGVKFIPADFLIAWEPNPAGVPV
jgi:co-chaperonin GroES (HSP10)